MESPRWRWSSCAAGWRHAVLDKLRAHISAKGGLHSFTLLFLSDVRCSLVVRLQMAPVAIDLGGSEEFGWFVGDPLAGLWIILGCS